MTWTLRRGLALATGLAAISCGGNDGGSDDPTDGVNSFGSLLNRAEFDASPDAILPEAFLQPPNPMVLPAKVTLNFLPAVSMQGTPEMLGSPGSCEAQSFGYGLGSYTAARNPDGTQKWDPAQPQNAVSAAYLYNFAHHQENRLCPKGTLATPYLQRLIAVGAPSAQDIAYQPQCSYLSAIPLDPSYPDIPNFRIGSFGTIKIKDDPAASVLLIKQLLASGQAVAFSGAVLTGYGKAPVFENGVIYQTSTVPNSGHGQLVVGYDDTVGTPGQPGAFLVQNSFGTAWPPASSGSTAPPGMAYWSYNTFTTTQSLAATAQPRDTSAVSSGSLTASPTSAPRAAITRSFQWAPASGGVYLILTLKVTDPLVLQSITLTEPTTGATFRGSYGSNFSTGYVYFKRTDGNQFLAGNYGVSLSAKSVAGRSISYAGTATIGSALPGSPPATAINSGTPMTDSTGESVVITEPVS